MLTFTYNVGVYIRDHPGCTSVHVARALKPQDSHIYGYQRKTSRAIAELRLKKLVVDVGMRCDKCGRALTRHVKNVPLFLTPRGVVLFDRELQPMLFEWGNPGDGRKGPPI